MDLFDINRVALIVTPSETLLRWAIQEDPTLAEDVDPEDRSELSSVFLLPDFDDMDAAEDWLEDHFRDILETVLEEWVADENDWPPKLEFSHFEKYTDYSLTSIVIDTMDASYDED